MISHYRWSPATLTRTVGDDVLLASAIREQMEVLSGTAGAVWGLLEAPRTCEEISTVLAREFGAAPEIVESDVEHLLKHLEEGGWIEESRSWRDLG